MWAKHTELSIFKRTNSQQHKVNVCEIMNGTQILCRCSITTILHNIVYETLASQTDQANIINTVFESVPPAAVFSP